MDSQALTIRRAAERDAVMVSSILTEAALWLEQRGQPLWQPSDFSPERLRADLSNGLYVLIESDGMGAGTMKFQLEDILFWPDVPVGESTFVHRLAIRRSHAGGALSQALLRWAVNETRALNRRYLRLDCDAARPRLRTIYERFGFQFHSEIPFGRLQVARYQYDVEQP